MGPWRADLRMAVRQVIRSPIYSLCVLVLVAACFGGNIAALGLIDAVMFRPLSVANPEDLYRIYTRPPAAPLSDFTSDEYLRLTSTANADVGGFADFDSGLSTGDKNTAINGQIVTSNFLSLLSPGFVLGTGFRSDGATPEVVISENIWRRVFDARSDIQGRSVTVNGKPFVIAGVVRFSGLSRFMATDIWVPINHKDYLDSRDLPTSSQSNSRWMQVVARVPAEARPGLEARLAGTIAFGRSASTPESPISVFNAHDVIVHPGVDRRWHALAAISSIVAAGIVLLTCANLAGVLLVRSAARQKEFAIRRAIGASPWAIARQLLIESSFLIAIGTVAGVLVGVWMGQLLAGAAAATAMSDRPIEVALRFDERTILTALVLFIVTCGLAAATPAFRLARFRRRRINIAEDDLNLSSWRSNKLLHGLIVPQVALSMVLLSAATLFIAGTSSQQKGSLGYSTDRSAFASVDLKLNGYDEARGTEFVSRVIDTLRTDPQVAFVGASDWPAVSDDFQTGGVRPGTSGRGPTAIARIDAVEPGLMEQSGFRLVEGRFFARQDSGQPVAIIDENSASRLWPGQPAVGQHLRVELGPTVGGNNASLYEVVGVIGNLHDYPLGRTSRIRLFVANPLPFRSRTNFHLRGTVDSDVLLERLNRAVRRVDPQVAILHGTTMSGYVDRLDEPAALAANSLLTFGALGLVIASLGVFGVVEQAARARKVEIGIRLALGAPHQKVIASLAGPAATMIVIGAVVGLTISMFMREPVSLSLSEARVGITSLLIPFGCVVAIGLLSSLLPTRRLLSTDVARVLRQD